MKASNTQEEGLNGKPKIEIRIEKVPGKNLIGHLTVITDVKPIAYYNAVIEKAQ